MRKPLLVCVACWALLAIAPAGAMAGTGEDVANDIAGRITSPFCPGVTLHDCPSGAAAALRSKIAAWAEAGRGPAQIMARLEADYGPEIRAVPRASGAGLVAWILPVVVLAAGAGVTLVLIRRWSAARPGEGPPPNTLFLSPSERRRVDDELAAFKGR